MNNFEILGVLLLTIFALLSGAAAFGFMRMVEQTRGASGWLGSGLIGHSQKMTVAASATAEKKTVGQRS